MPDYISGRILKMKALERWENEGGRVCAAETGSIKSGSPDMDANNDNAAQTFKSQAADKNKWEKNLQ